MARTTAPTSSSTRLAPKLVLKIESPEKKGWMLHVDPETGVKGRFWTEPLEVTFPEWNYTPQEW